MYTIQPNYDAMLGSYLDRVSAEQEEESRRADEALRLEKEYRSAIIRKWAETAIEDGEENYDLNDQANWADHIDWFLLERDEERLPLDIPMPTWQECVAALATPPLEQTTAQRHGGSVCRPSSDGERPCRTP